MKRGLAAAVVGVLAVLASCGGEPSEPIASGRIGGPPPDESCEWTIRRGPAIRGELVLNVTDADGSSGRSVRPADGVNGDADDVVAWLYISTPCNDSPSYVFGGVSLDVGSVELADGAGDVIELTILDVGDGGSGAVFEPIPNEWRSLDSFEVAAMSSDGDVIASERCLMGSCVLSRSN